MDRFRRITRKVREHRLVSSKSTEHLDTVDGGKYEQSSVTSKEFQSPAFPSEGFAVTHKRSRSRKSIPWEVPITEGEDSSKNEDRKQEKLSPPTLKKVGKSRTSPSKMVKASTLETIASLSQREQTPSPPSFRPKPRPASMVLDSHSSSAGSGMQKVDENRSLESLTFRKPRKRLAPTDVPVILPKVNNKKPSTVDKLKTEETVKNDAGYSLNSSTASSTVDTTDNPLLGIESVFDRDNSGSSGEGADPQLQHVTQAPPLLDKRPPPQSPTQDSFPLQSSLTNGHDMSDGGERLQHITQNRPRGPARRPPSAIFKGNMRHSSGDSESSSLSIESPPKSNNLTGNPKLDFTSSARLSPPQPPVIAKPVSNTHTPLPSSPAPAANKEIDQALSSIVLRANSGRAGSTTPSSIIPTSENEPPAPSRSPMARPKTTFMGGANQSNVPWLQELNAKQQKRKSHNFEPGGKDGDSPAPPVSAKPTGSSPVKPQSKLQSSTQPQSDPPTAKQATKNIFTPQQFGGSQQQKPSASSFSSTTTPSQPLDVVDSIKAPQQPQQPATPASRAPKHTSPQSTSTASIQPDVELRRPYGHPQPPLVTIVQPDVQDRRTPSISSQHSSTAESHLPDVQQLRKPITEPDVISSASSSRKSSAASTSASSNSSSSAVATAVAATKLDCTALEESFVTSPRTASFAGDGEPARVSNPISATAMVRAAHGSGSVSSVTGSQVSLLQTPAPSPQPSVAATESLAAPVDTSSTTTVLPPSPLPSTAQGTNTSSTFVPQLTPSSHPSKKHSNSDKAGSVLSSDSVVPPRDISEDAKALDNANAILNKLLPKVSALENRLEEQKREHTRQLNLLMSELDDERKKRACLEIEMERLKKMVLAYTTQV